jgi:hypothetical protein
VLVVLGCLLRVSFLAWGVFFRACAGDLALVAQLDRTRQSPPAIVPHGRQSRRCSSMGSTRPTSWCGVLRCVACFCFCCISLLCSGWGVKCSVQEGGGGRHCCGTGCPNLSCVCVFAFFGTLMTLCRWPGGRVLAKEPEECRALAVTEEKKRGVARATVARHLESHTGRPPSQSDAMALKRFHCTPAFVNVNVAPWSDGRLSWW